MLKNKKNIHAKKSFVLCPVFLDVTCQSKCKMSFLWRIFGRLFFFCTTIPKAIGSFISVSGSLWMVKVNIVGAEKSDNVSICPKMSRLWLCYMSKTWPKPGRKCRKCSAARAANHYQDVHWKGSILPKAHAFKKQNGTYTCSFWYQSITYFVI